VLFVVDTDGGKIARIVPDNHRGFVLRDGSQHPRVTADELKLGDLVRVPQFDDNGIWTFAPVTKIFRAG
jgi:hypothetical protein